MWGTGWVWAWLVGGGGGCERLEFRDLSAFYQKELPREDVENAFRQAPCQFQRQMNAVNMYNVKYPMPMLDALWQTREEEMEAEYAQCVLLVSGFVKVLAARRREA